MHIIRKCTQKMTTLLSSIIATIACSNLNNLLASLNFHVQLFSVLSFQGVFLLHLLYVPYSCRYILLVTCHSLLTVNLFLLMLLINFTTHSSYIFLSNWFELLNFLTFVFHFTLNSCLHMWLLPQCHPQHWDHWCEGHGTFHNKNGWSKRKGEWMGLETGNGWKKKDQKLKTRNAQDEKTGRWGFYVCVNDKKLLHKEIWNALSTCEQQTKKLKEAGLLLYLYK